MSSLDLGSIPLLVGHKRAKEVKRQRVTPVAQAPRKEDLFPPHASKQGYPQVEFDEGTEIYPIPRNNRLGLVR